MDADKKKDWLKTSARKVRIKKIKRKKAISGDVVQENIIESNSRVDFTTRMLSEMDNFASKNNTSKMLSEIDNFASKNQSPKSDLDIISSVMGQEVKTVDTYHKKTLNSEIPTLDSIINDLKEFKLDKKKFEKFIDDIPNLVDLEKFNKEIFSLKESIKKSKSNEILAEEVKQELLDEISKVDKRVTTQYHNAGSGEVRVLNMDDVDITDIGDTKQLSYSASEGKLKFVGAGESMSSVAAMSIALGG